jgi:hypothetical protein
MENFKHIWTTIIGCIMMLAFAGLYYASLIVDKLSDIGWKQCLWPFILGVYLLFAKDDDILAPIKAIINIFIKKGEDSKPEIPK